jgi:hypothetical protein
MHEGSCGELTEVRDLGQALVEVGAGELSVDGLRAVSEGGFTGEVKISGVELSISWLVVRLIA